VLSNRTATVKDTGKVESNLTSVSPFKLDRQDTDFWVALTIWDENDIPSAETKTNFSTGMFDWTDAQWIGAGSQSAGNLLRKSFHVPGTPIRGRSFVACPGYCRTYVNGVVVDDGVLGHQTTYEKTILYNTGDLTHLLVEGNNTVGVELGHGWYTLEEAKMKGSGLGNMSVKLVLTAETSDHTVRVVSDKSFRQHAGPIVADNIYDGEVYDGRLEQVGWSTPTFDAASWTAAEGVPDPGGNLKSATVYPKLARTNAYNPVSIVDSSASATAMNPFTFNKVISFGQNIAGWVRVKVPPHHCTGCNLTIIHSEQLNGADGGKTVDQLYPKSPMIQTYLLRGDGKEEILEPRFSWYGFEWVQVSGLQV
jgi:alpha-L-rhamnosidase